MELINKINSQNKFINLRKKIYENINQSKLCKFYNNKIINIQNKDISTLFDVDDIYINSIYFDNNIYISGNKKNKFIFISKLLEKNILNDYILIDNMNKCKIKSFIIIGTYIYACGYFEKSLTIGHSYLYTEYYQMFTFKYCLKTKEYIWVSTSNYGNKNEKSKSLYIKFYNNELYLIGKFKNNMEINNYIKLKINNEFHNIFIIKIDIFNGNFLDFNYYSFENNPKINYINYIRNNISIETNYGILLYNNNFKFYKLEYNNGIYNVFNKLLYKTNDYISNNIADKQFNNIFAIYSKNIKIGKYQYNHENNNVYLCKLNNDGKIQYLDNIIENNYISKIKLHYFNDQIFILIKFINKIIVIKYIENENFKKMQKYCIVKTIDENNFANIEIFGKLVNIEKLLLPDYEYYIQDNGELDIFSNNNYIGYAINENEMIIKQ